MIAADTNAILYAMLPGEFHVTARAWLAASSTVHAAPLLMDEVRNVLLGHVRRGLMSEPETLEVCARVRLHVRWLPAPPDEMVMRLALAHRLSAYDAAHVAASVIAGCRLLTADKKVLAACPEWTADVRLLPAGPA